MKPHPKLTKDGTAELCSGQHRFTGDEDTRRQDLCKEFRVIPADWQALEEENWVVFSNLMMLISVTNAYK
jgi:hypothetical protein